MQRERQDDLYREENSSKSENRQQSDHKGKGLSVDLNMIFMLPMEFLAPSCDDEGVDLPDQIPQLVLDLMMAILRSRLIMKVNISSLCSLKAGLMDSQYLKY
jgi:hypothetical protein